MAMSRLLHTALNRLLRLPQQSLILLVRGYRFLLKPWLGSACRFEPTCSAYAIEALQRHGALGGSALTGWRLLRCQPWCNVCRYYPGCSQYVLDALNRHGALGGTSLAAWRVLRCNPWSLGGCDPVPEHFPHPAAGLFTRLELNVGSEPQPTTPDPTVADARPPTRNLP